jgi:hypothetical protein
MVAFQRKMLSSLIGAALAPWLSVGGRVTRGMGLERGLGNKDLRLPGGEKKTQQGKIRCA